MYGLDSFLDDNGVCRVGGQLKSKYKPEPDASNITATKKCDDKEDYWLVS